MFLENLQVIYFIEILGNLSVEEICFNHAFFIANLDEESRAFGDV